MLFHHSTLVTERLFRTPTITDPQQTVTDRRMMKRRQRTALHSLSLSSLHRAIADIACSCTAQKRGQNGLSKILAFSELFQQPNANSAAPLKSAGLCGPKKTEPPFKVLEGHVFF